MLVSSNSPRKITGTCRASGPPADVSGGAGPMRSGNHQLKVDSAATVNTTRPMSARKATSHPPHRRIEREITLPQRLELALCSEDQLAHVARRAASAGARRLPVDVLLHERVRVFHGDREPLLQQLRLGDDFVADVRGLLGGDAGLLQ